MSKLKTLSATGALILLTTVVAGCSTKSKPQVSCPAWVDQIQPACTDRGMSNYLFNQIDLHNAKVAAACDLDPDVVCYMEQPTK